MSVPTAAALKMGVGFPLTIPGSNDDTNRVLSTQCQKSQLLYDCGICKRVNDQHLLAKCDTCHLHYHLGCLNPPLTRHPKKSKIYGWQCSECDEDNPEGVVPLTSGPRKSRTKYSKDGTIVPVDSSRDVSLDGSGADGDDEKVPVQSVKSPIPDKSPPPTPIKKVNKTCDNEKEKTPAKKRKSVSQSFCDEYSNTRLMLFSFELQSLEDTIISPVLSNSSMSEANKSESGSKSPLKCRKSFTGSSTNLDKVIEAVSKGILEATDEPINSTNNDEPIQPLKVNGVKAELNEAKSPVPTEKSSPQPKVKASKKAKKEKDKEKGTEKEKDKTKEKDKDKDKKKEKVKKKEKNVDKKKETDDGKDKEKEKAKNKIKEKSKRKMKLKITADPNPPPSTVNEIKEETHKINPNAHAVNTKVDSHAISNQTDKSKMDISVDSTNTSEVNTSKLTPAVSADNSFNGDASAAHNNCNGKTEDTPAPTTPTAPTNSLEAAEHRKQSRKRRKEKHRSKHGPDEKRSSSKEHKKKRKRKNHDHENPEAFPIGDGVPKIKIKVFCI